MRNSRTLLVSAIACIIAPILSAAPNSWDWSHSNNVLRVNANSGGQITEWRVDGKSLIKEDTSQSPLSLVTPEGRTLKFVADSSQTISTNQFQLTGHLRDGDTAIPLTLSYEVLENGAKLALRIEPSSAPADLRVAEFAWSQSLALQPRKRVFLLGDHGLGWEERYFYQLALQPSGWSIMPEPDRNEWRYFGLDQLSANATRLWKSEADTTAPLLIQAGHQAAPITQLYDETGGVTLDYPALATRAPAALRLDASDGGRVAIQFWPRFAAPTSAAEALRGSPAWTLTAHNNEDDVLSKQESLANHYADTASPRPDPEKILDEAPWLLDTPLATDAPAYVTGGHPFARGELTDTAAIRVHVAGQPVPVQSRALAYWPDRSIKWALLTFPVDASRAVASCEPPRVSLRDGRFLPLEISVGSGTLPVTPSSVTTTQNATGETIIRTGRLEATLTLGKNWLRSLQLDGQPILDPARGSARIYSEHLRDPEAFFPFDHQAKGGRADHGVLDVKTLEIEESGAQRTVIRLEGLTTNEEPLRVVLRLEFFAGRPEIRLTHTVVLRLRDPRQAYITGLGLELPLSADFAQNAIIDTHTFAAKSTTSASRVQAVAAPAQIIAQPINQPFPDRTTTTQEAGAIGLAGPAGGVSVVLRHARELAPNALTVDLSERRLRVEFWPHAAGPMDLRRYSGHLKFGQLESGAPDPASEWVENHYYKQDPVYGISRTHEVLLSFGSAPAPAALQSLAADFTSPPLLYSGHEYYSSAGITLPSSSSADWPRAWESWTRLTRFFLFHRELYGWHGFWNHGDFRHRMGGFGCTVPPEILKDMPAGNLIKVRIWDAIPSNDWGYDNGAYGWTNTEGLPGMFLAQEYLRHGNRTVYFAMEAMARYARDVIVRQEGRWLGRGTRHGVQPWSDGNHEERQTAATEWRHHYLLSGEGRTRDVIENLYQNVYLKGAVNRHASHSGRLPGLLFHWELTGDPAEGERLRNYVHQFLSDEGVHLSPHVLFPDATKGGAPKDLNSGSQFFHTFGGMHTFEEYHRLTADPTLRTALIKMADAIIAKPIIEEGRLGIGDYSWPPVAFAALHAEDPAPYTAFLRRYIERTGWRSAYQPVTINPQHWTGPSAMMTHTVALSFYWANWAPYVTRSLGEEIWSPNIEQAFEKFEQRGRPTPPHRTSWQSEFDGIPELDTYLGPQQPWRRQ